jgi:hypothetical protein
MEAWERGENQDIPAAYEYVDSVLHTADDPRSLGWHGWALREAFLAGITHGQSELDSIRTALATAERETAEAKRLRSEAISSHRSRKDEIERMQKRAATAELERDAAIAERDSRPYISGEDAFTWIGCIGGPTEKKVHRELKRHGLAWAATKHRTESET